MLARVRRMKGLSEDKAILQGTPATTLATDL